MTAAVDEGYSGFQQPWNNASEFDRIAFQIYQALGLLHTATLVKVIACSNSDAVAAVGTVTVQPMVNIIDGRGKATPHGNLVQIPYFRIQGGVNAVILDPKAGDIGLAVFADRDISVVKNTKAAAPPGSFRRFDFADGLYLGGFLNAAPQQYVRFHSGGISITDNNNNTIVMDSAGITINGVLISRTRNISNVVNITGSGEVTFNGHTLTAHVHTGVQAGGSNTGGPVG